MSKSDLKCPYCGGRAPLVDSKVIYGRSYGLAYVCRPCDAHVGVHKGTTRPLGSLANKETRKARMAAHAMFDPIWKNKFMRRAEAYEELAKRLGVPKIHIGESDVETCGRIKEVADQMMKEIFGRKQGGK